MIVNDKSNNLLLNFINLIDVRCSYVSVQTKQKTMVGVTLIDDCQTLATIATIRRST